MMKDRHQCQFSFRFADLVRKEVQLVTTRSTKMKNPLFGGGATHTVTWQPVWTEGWRRWRRLASFIHQFLGGKSFLYTSAFSHLQNCRRNLKTWENPRYTDRSTLTQWLTRISFVLTCFWCSLSASQSSYRSEGENPNFLVESRLRVFCDRNLRRQRHFIGAHKIRDSRSLRSTRLHWKAGLPTSGTLLPRKQAHFGLPCVLKLRCCVLL